MEFTLGKKRAVATGKRHGPQWRRGPPPTGYGSCHNFPVLDELEKPAQGKACDYGLGGGELRRMISSTSEPVRVLRSSSALTSRSNAIQLSLMM